MIQAFIDVLIMADLRKKEKESTKTMYIEEKKYLEQQEKEKNKTLLQENAGSIHIKKTGKVIKVNRDLEEIKNVQEEVSQDKVRVLDFTKEKINISSPSSPKFGVVKKGSNLIAN